MTKRKPCRVEITQVPQEGTTGYIVNIDKPGSPVPYKLMDAERPNKVKRYITRWSAKRGALRNLGAVIHPSGVGYVMLSGTPVEFVFTTSKRRK